MTGNSTDLCELIRAVLSEAVGSDLGPEDDFFAAGGDSLAAEQVLAALSTRLSRPVEGWMLLDHPTATSLAAALSATR
ncbi:acyl carrier protein [Aliigemmobacter aestuarii]|uniref:Acyl carrier protein n=1 Tax=Aliigemmobacter aestuarii TaxID=1445661 RepID=A0A4S3MNQ6_9RHOB|nr:acyl carrier protein [Gemmobacter aestuarii]THD82769.1 acyl carrier protein [Gemmobacter aestuarii]